MTRSRLTRSIAAAVSSFALAVTALVGAPPALAQPSLPLPLWHEESPPTHPSARRDAEVAYDAGSQQMVLYGGRYTTDTWSWDGSAWTQLHPTRHPSARSRFAMADDRARDQIVFFGGWTSETRQLGDTWVFKDGQWSRAWPAQSPPPLESHMMTYDLGRDEVVLFGGAKDFDFFSNETWTWNGTTWHRETPTHSPPARTMGALGYDRARGEVVLFGGYAVDGLYEDTWTWDGSDWTERSPRESPPHTGNPGMALLGRHSVMIDGLTDFAGSATSDLTWRLGRNTWTELELSPTPPGRYDPAAAWDPVHHETLLFGGASSDDESLDDTWTLRPGR